MPPQCTRLNRYEKYFLQFENMVSCLFIYLFICNERKIEENESSKQEEKKCVIKFDFCHPTSQTADHTFEFRGKHPYFKEGLCHPWPPILPHPWSVGLHSTHFLCSYWYRHLSIYVHFFPHCARHKHPLLVECILFRGWSTMTNVQRKFLSYIMNSK